MNEYNLLNSLMVRYRVLYKNDPPRKIGKVVLELGKLGFMHVYARYIYSWMGLYINLQPEQLCIFIVGLAYLTSSMADISIVGLVYHRHMLPFKDQCWETNIPSYEDQIMRYFLTDWAPKTNTSMVTIYMIIGETTVTIWLFNIAMENQHF